MSISPVERISFQPIQIRYAAPTIRSQSNHQPIACTSEARPTATIAMQTARPACVPATLSSPARVPWVRLLATISVTVGPGTMTITMVASR